jgi:hypothetical protein
MKRKSIFLSLALSAGAIVAVVYGTGLLQPQGAVKYPPGEASQVHQAESAEPDASSVNAPQSSQDDIRANSDDESPAVNEARRNSNMADEEATAKWVREDLTREVPEDYSLLLKHLGLTLSEEESLLQFLIEDEIARTKTRYSDGIGMDEHERSARIAEIIGDAKLQQFLALENNLGEYKEVQYVQSALQEKGVPLTDTQQDRLLKIVIDTREQIDTNLPAHLKPGSMEALEHRLNQIDENDRLVVELASSVLSVKQVEYVFERNQAHSYRRADILEWHKQRRADNPDDDLPLSYPAKRD